MRAEEIFAELQSVGFVPDIYTYNALLEAYRFVDVNLMITLPLAVTNVGHKRVGPTVRTCVVASLSYVSCSFWTRYSVYFIG